MSNYLIIPELKVILNIGEDIEELEDSEEESLDNITKADVGTFEDVDGLMDKNIDDISIRELYYLYHGYVILSTLAGIDIDKFLLYWLDEKEIEYEIKSGEEIDFEEFKRMGFQIK